MSLPLATLDHVVINVRDRMDDAAVIFRRLGFSLTRRGHHTLGSINHLAIFGTDYLELIGVPPGSDKRPDILGAPFGLNGLVFGTEDSGNAYSSMRLADVPCTEPLEFSRPVILDDGTSGDATFRTVTLTPGTIPAGRVYFCHHFTRHLVWRDEWRSHPNGVVAVARTVIASRNPQASAEVFRRMFRPESVREIPGGYSLVVGLSRVDILTPDALTAQFGDAAPSGDGRAEFMAALTFRTRSLAAVTAVLSENGIFMGVRREATRVVVPAAEAYGCALEFWE